MQNDAGTLAMLMRYSAKLSRLWMTSGLLMASTVISDAQVFPSFTGNIMIETFAKGLDHPWALAFLPDGRMLVTERPGGMRIVGKDGTLYSAFAGVPKVFASGHFSFICFTTAGIRALSSSLPYVAMSCLAVSSSALDG